MLLQLLRIPDPCRPPWFALAASCRAASRAYPRCSTRPLRTWANRVWTRTWCSQCGIASHQVRLCCGDQAGVDGIEYREEVVKESSRGSQCTLSVRH